MRVSSSRVPLLLFCISMYFVMKEGVSKGFTRISEDNNRQEWDVSLYVQYSLKEISIFMKCNHPILYNSRELLDNFILATSSDHRFSSP
jgi:hypothetical protein